MILHLTLLALFTLPLLYFSGGTAVGGEEIQWMEWGPEAFDRAKREDKPILLDITAVWCHWCHVMDEVTYSNEEIIQIVNELYIPVRVESEKRPDVRDRYLMGGWPTTALLTPDGEVLTGGTFFPPETLKPILINVSSIYKERRDDIHRQIEAQREEQRKASSREAKGPSAPINEEIIARVAAAILESYDEENGGFGSEPKFPLPTLIDFALEIGEKDGNGEVKVLALHTLEATRNLQDPVDGGFYRYSVTADWKTPHYERMLNVNADLIRNYIYAYQATGMESFRDTALEAVEYVNTTLSDQADGGFYGSQDADVTTDGGKKILISGEEYFPLSAEERAGHGTPHVDKGIYADWNGNMISSYLQAFAATGNEALRDFAVKSLNFLLTHSYRPGRGIYHYYMENGERGGEGMLSDQVYFLQALLDTYEATGERVYLEKGVELANWVDENFTDDGEPPYYDLKQREGAVHVMKMRRFDQELNSLAARNLIRLRYLTDDETYKDRAEKILEHFADTYGKAGLPAVSSYALAVERLLHYPLEISIVGSREHPSTGKFIGEGLRFFYPGKIIRVLDPADDMERLERLGYSIQEEPVVYACVEKLCSEPVDDPDRLLPALKKFIRAATQ